MPAASCSGELSNLAPTVDSCPQDTDLILFCNVTGVTGGYAFRTWGKIKTCLLSQALKFIKYQFTVGNPGVVLQPGQDTLEIDQPNIINGSVFITFGGPELPEDDTNQISYIVDYTDPMKVIITFNQGAQGGQLYIIHYAYVS